MDINPRPIVSLSHSSFESFVYPKYGPLNKDQNSSSCQIINIKKTAEVSVRFNVNFNIAIVIRTVLNIIVGVAVCFMFT